MKKILVLSFDDIKGANCAHCMLSFSKGEKYHCAALGNYDLFARKREIGKIAHWLMNRKTNNRKRGLIMGKRKMIFYGVAALFAVSGVAALPSGDITGGWAVW